MKEGVETNCRGWVLPQEVQDAVDRWIFAGREVHRVPMKRGYSTNKLAIRLATERRVFQWYTFAEFLAMDMNDPRFYVWLPSTEDWE